jgi:hypothetical protein
VTITGFNDPNVAASFSDGVLTLTSVPEPSVYGLLISGVAMMIPVWRRAKR